MTDPGGTPRDLVPVFEGFRAIDAVQTSPLYDHLNTAFIAEPELAAPLLAAPPAERLPLLMFQAREAHLDLRRGDLFDLLPAAVAEAPHDAVVVVLSSHVMPYLAREDRQAFAERVIELSRTRALMLVLNEDHRLGRAFGIEAPGERGYVAASFVDFTGAQGPTAAAFAKVDPHGSWLEWIPARDPATTTTATTAPA
ncbi:hypothetical protein ABIA35_004284 [Catenulispora sp. MAP12-49]|uniref:DUF2332 family protein n=1 Tax=Catenulispora sp. MAP12-49 TaxID=3156302 RepID=UPI0035193D13